MTTIYTNQAQRTVELELPVTPAPLPITIEVFKDGVVVHEVPTVAFEDGMLKFELPYFLSQTDNYLEVRWRFSYVENGQTYEFNNTTQVEVVSPILSLREINAIVRDGADWELDELMALEKSVRHIIQAHTGQFFGKFIGRKRVAGSGESFLRLPARLLELKSINGSIGWNEVLSVRGSGWFLESRATGIPTIRADYDGWHENPYTGHVPIVAPYSKVLMSFNKHMEYEIDGVWGWHSVPGAVKEAARLLINDYACADSNYRDRFLTSMTAADWRIQFHEGAFSNTGNVRANQLLAEYVLRRGWVVI